MNPNELENISETIIEILKDNLFIDDIDDLLIDVQRLIEKKEKLNLKTLSLDDDTLYLEVFYINNSSINIEFLLKRIEEEKNENADYYNNYKFYIFFSKIEDQIRFEKEYSSDASFTKIAKEKVKCKFKIQVRTIFMPSIDFSRPYIINIDSYLKRIDKSVGQNEAFVCSAKLHDIIALYNDFGDSLFLKNVRVKIKDAIGVDKAITLNLEKEPNNFWFYSNGISMIVNKACFSNDIEDQLKFNLTSISDISVVNGAQSITVSSQYYYALDEEKRESLNGADVLLRLIFSNNNEDFCNNITLALNRQKPIKQSDIRYFSPVIDTINSLSFSEQNKNFTFKILKNGEKVNSNHSYELEKFGKIVTCYYLQKPGTSRSAKGSIFENDDIWNKFDLDDNNLELDFLKKYKPLNYTMKLYDYSHKYLSESADPDDPYDFKLRKNCTEFFVAYYIWKINKKNNLDFSTFEETFEENIINNSIENFVKDVYQFFDDPIEIDSNYFKKDDNYYKIRAFLDKKK